MHFAANWIYKYNLLQIEFVNKTNFLIEYTKRSWIRSEFNVT